MRHPKLKNAPLQEVVFQVKWNLSIESDQGIPSDKGYERAVTHLYEHLLSKFPYHVDFENTEEPHSSRNIRHQFWTSEEEWPVIQFGPGILTINETDKNYIWDETYRPLISFVIDALEKSYDHKLIFDNISLQYINAIEVAKNVTDFNDFLHSAFNVSIENHFSIPGIRAGIDLSQGFILSDRSVLKLSIQTAVNRDKPANAILWTTHISQKGELSKEEILEWIDVAHGYTSDLFVNILKPEFYDSFNN